MQKRGLNGAQLKLLAIITMVIDHVAWVFVPEGTVLGFVMHFLGRITGPIMFFFIAEGYRHTRDVGRYMRRLLVFGLVSQLPYSLAFGYPFVLIPMNIMFTLALGLFALDYGTRAKSRLAAGACLAGCCAVAVLMDWAFFGVLLIYIFGRTRSFGLQLAQFGVVTVACIGMDMLGASGISPGWSLYHLGMFVPLLLLRRYNGERGSLPGGRWGFYAAYPVHLLVLGGLRVAFV